MQLNVGQSIPKDSVKVGDSVCIQNQIGPHPLKWDKTGRVVESSSRNRKFLRKYLPVHMPTNKGTLPNITGITAPHTAQPLFPIKPAVDVPPRQTSSDDTEITSTPPVPKCAIPQLATPEDPFTGSTRPDQHSTPGVDHDSPSGLIRNNPATQPRRSTWKTRQPAWYSDYEMTL